jgi:SP family arabinose:H+ symporter-like MFS transporter
MGGVLAGKINLGYLIFLAATAALGGLLFGFDIAIITGAGPFLTHHFQLNDLSLGWAFSSLLFGCVIGSTVAGRLTNRYGRRSILLWVAVLFSATSIATGMAPSFATFVLARFIGGLAVGGASILSPMYVAEVSPPSLRGRMGTLYQLSIVVGILMSYCINYLLRNAGAANWRWMFMTGVIPSVIFFLCCCCARPRRRGTCFWPAGNARGWRFWSASRDARAPNRRPSKSAPAWPRSATPGSICCGLESGARWWSALSWPSWCTSPGSTPSSTTLPPSCAPPAGSSMPRCFPPSSSGSIISCSRLVSFWMIDRYGRKPLYIVGSLGMAAALTLLAATVAAGRFQGTVVLILILGYLAFFASCIGPVFWTLVSEIFPNNIRGTAMAVPVLTQWIANAVVVLFFPYAFNQIGKAVTFGFLAAMAIAQAVVTWRWVPETKNKTLEEIERAWADRRGSGDRSSRQVRGPHFRGWAQSSRHRDVPCGT